VVMRPRRLTRTDRTPIGWPPHVLGARLPRQWTDLEADDPTVVIGAGRAPFRYVDLCRLGDLLARLTQGARATGS
jgi:hypothetical protein